MSYNREIERSKLWKRPILEIRELYRKLFPGNPTSRRGITKSYLINRIVNEKWDEYVSTLDVDVVNYPAEIVEYTDTEQIKRLYRSQINDAFERLSEAIEQIPTNIIVFSGLWSESSKFKPWIEYHRELSLIGQSDKDTVILGDMQKTKWKVTEEYRSFANRYPIVTWVLGKTDSRLAAAVIVSLYTDLEVIMPLKSNFSIEALARSVNDDISKKIFEEMKNRYHSNQSLSDFHGRTIVHCATEGHKLGIEMAIQSDVIIHGDISKIRRNIYRGARESAKYNQLDAFKALYPYITKDDLFDIVYRAGASVLVFMHDNEPDLPSYVSHYNDGTGAPRYWDWDDIFRRMVNRPDAVQELIALMLWNPPRIHLEIMMKYAITNDDVIRFLLEYGINPNISFIQYVITNKGSESILELYISKGADLGRYGKEAVCINARMGSLKGVKLLVDKYGINDKETIEIAIKTVKQRLIYHREYKRILQYLESKL